LRLRLIFNRRRAIKALMGLAQQPKLKARRRMDSSLRLKEIMLEE
jgi:hypothetical protein